MHAGAAAEVDGGARIRSASSSTVEQEPRADVDRRAGERRAVCAHPQAEVVVELASRPRLVPPRLGARARTVSTRAFCRASTGRAPSRTIAPSTSFMAVVRCFTMPPA